MKKLIITFVNILASALVVYSQSFTGVVQFQNENFEAGEKSDITCYLKSPLCKMEIKSTAKEGTTQYTLYFDDRTSDVVMLAGGNKTVIPTSSIQGNKYLQNIFLAVAKDGQLNLAGFNCNEVQLKSTSSTIISYVTTEIDIVFPLMLNNQGMIKALKENNIQGTPLSIEVKDLSGKPLFSQKVVSIERKNLAENELQAQ